MALREQQHGDDAHGLLGVVAAVAERVERGRNELQHAEAAGRPRRACSPREQPGRRSGRAAAPGRSRSAATGRWPRSVLAEAAPDDGADARLRDAGAHRARRSGHGSCSTGCRRSQVTTFQTIAPIRAPKIDLRVDHVGGDDPLADGLGDVQAEEQEGDEVEEGRPERPRIAGRSTRVETMVAIELAASCRPLRKSNSSATPMRRDQERQAERDSVHVLARLAVRLSRSRCR